jgi:hypothetical protein
MIIMPKFDIGLGFLYSPKRSGEHSKEDALDIAFLEQKKETGHS